MLEGVKNGYSNNVGPIIKKFIKLTLWKAVTCFVPLVLESLRTATAHSCLKLASSLSNLETIPALIQSTQLKHSGEATNTKERLRKKVEVKRNFNKIKCL